MEPSELAKKLRSDKQFRKRHFEYLRGIEWFCENGFGFLWDNYPNKWVAIYNSKVICAGDDYDAVKKEAMLKVGKPNAGIFVDYVEEPGITYSCVR